MFRFVFAITAVFLITDLGSAQPWQPDAATGFSEAVFSSRQAAETPGPISLPGIMLIRLYQEVLSPQDGATCSFTPTCSQYGKSAIAKYGIIKGSIMAGDRLIRDNPFSDTDKTDFP